MRRLLSRCLGAVLAILVVAPLSAQTDPRGEYRTLKTDNFYLHFHASHDSLARRAASIAEIAWQRLSKELVAPHGRIELLITDNSDLSNGYASTFPSNRITIFALPPVFAPELHHYNDWLELVITHELAHIFHLDRSAGIWGVARKVFGRHPALMPNTYLPSWIIEGLAVHYETSLTGSGRLASSEFPMIARSAALRASIPSIGSWSRATTKYPLGQSAYAYGSLLLSQLIAEADSGGVRNFVETIASHPLPYRIDRASRVAFGRSFSEQFRVFRDSLLGSTSDIRNWSSKDTATRSAYDAIRWNASPPRWESDSSILISVNNGRDIPGLYRVVDSSGVQVYSRVGRRNSLDVTSIASNGEMLWGEMDYEDSYVLRSRLRMGSVSGHVSDIPNTLRVQHPDLRQGDDRVVAVRALAGSTELVLVDKDSDVRVLAASSIDTSWAEPRWSPDGSLIAAVRYRSGAVRDLVILDTLGRLVKVVESSRSVIGNPVWAADGNQLLWSSDVNGNHQIMRASLIDCEKLCRTFQITSSATGIVAPDVSPDGRRIAALEYGLEGWRLVVLPFLLGEPANETDRLPFSVSYGDVTDEKKFVSDTSSSTAYNALRQLSPRWWMPLVSEAADGGAAFGISSSGSDILQRHSWVASATFNPRKANWEGNFAWRIRGLPALGNWQTVLDLSALLQQDIYGLVDSTGERVGLLSRQSQSALSSFVFTKQRLRATAAFSLGVGGEWFSYQSSPDTLIRSLHDRFVLGHGVPKVSIGAFFSNATGAVKSVGFDQGFSLSSALDHYWLSGPEQKNSLRINGVLRTYMSFPVSTYARHSLAFRISAGLTDRHSNSAMSAGGTSGQTTELLPGVRLGDPVRAYPVRGFVSGSQSGSRALSGTFEYRMPLSFIGKGVGLYPLYADRVSLAVFTDAGRAWCGNSDVFAGSGICSRSDVRSTWLSSMGTELILDLGIPWDHPMRMRLGIAKPLSDDQAALRRSSIYFTLGSNF